MTGLVGVATAYTLFLLVPALAAGQGQERRAALQQPGGSDQAMSTRHGDPATAQRIPRRLRVAQLVGELLSPPPILVVLALVVAWDSSPTLGMAVLWGGIAALSASVLPYAIILRGVRQGRLSDKNISLREQRIRFAVVAITSILIGLAVMAAFDAPSAMVALLASIAVGVVCGWVITLWWKISVHAAIAAGAATVLLLVFGPALLAVWPLVAVIAWSRVQVGDHTPAQVLAGVALGVVVNATVFSLLR
jgi:membrane-associated phospholipid phosphatase